MADRGGYALQKQTFIKTEQYLKCKSVFEEQRLILITGNAGSGKTTIAQRLLKDQIGRSSAHCFKICRPEELDFVGHGTTILFDDIFGRYDEDVLMTIAWYSRTKTLVEKSKRVFFILTSREDLYSRCSDRTELQFPEKFVVRLSSIELTKEDRENVIVGFDYPFGANTNNYELFQACDIWSRLKQETFLGVTSNVSETSLQNFFQDMFKRRKDLSFAILMTLIFGNKLTEDNWKSSKLYEVAKRIGYDTNEKKFKMSLDTLSKSLLEKDENSYSISSTIVVNEACKCSLKHYPEAFIDYCDLIFLNKLSKHFDNMDHVHIERLCGRLCSELNTLVKLKLFNTLKNDRTLQIFLENLSGCKEQLDMFLNSDFFWFACWSNSFIIVERLLRRIKDRKSIVETAVGCSSLEMMRLLKRYLTQDSSEATNTCIPESPSIYEEMDNPLSHFTTFEALKCQIEDFPRLRYHGKLLRGLGDRFVSLQAEEPRLNSVNFVHWDKVEKNPIIYLAGETRGHWENLPFLSVDKTTRQKETLKTKDVHKSHPKLKFSDFEGWSLSCIVYRCFEGKSKQENISLIKKLSMDIANSELTGMGSCVMVVLNCGIPFTLLDENFQDIDVPKSNVQIVISNGEREDLLELLTSAFEVPMNEYITLLQSNLCIESMSSAKRIRSLKTESDALLMRLRLSSKLPKEPVTASSSMTVPNEVLKELDKNADHIYGYGFRPEEFYILVNDRLSPGKKKSLEGKIRKSIQNANFSWKVKFVNSNGVHYTKHFGSGSPIVPDEKNPDKYGTLGGFAHVNRKDVVGLTNFHVVDKGIEAYVKDGDNLIKLGKCEFVLVPGLTSLADFALIEVNNGLTERCRKPLVDDEDQPKNATIYLGKPSLIVPAIVHKKGASTGITQGTVVEMMTYREVLGKRETHSAFLVEDLEQPFSVPGDSGSLVFQNSFSASQESIEVVAILNGRYTEQGETAESKFVLCSDMKYIYDELKSKGKHLQFFKKEEESP
eukprot:XP_011437805.1 PREDICTED: uncharacterized protein LOC105335550 [Crassostrea gigas]